MKMKIALASAGTDSSNFGNNYSDWQIRMKATKDFGKIERLDDNKMVARDTGGNIIETFVIDNALKNKSVDTLDSEQHVAPATKTDNDVRTGDSTQEKGA